MKSIYIETTIPSIATSRPSRDVLIAGRQAATLLFWENERQKMEYIDVDPIAEVRRNRELLLEMYGGIEGLLKHMDEERPLLEEQGWVFTSIEEILSKKQGQTASVI